MNSYVTGAMIRRLRENKKLTQQQLAEKLKANGIRITTYSHIAE